MPVSSCLSSRTLADCAHGWKPETRVGHANNFRNHILPGFGTRCVDAVTSRKVHGWFDELSMRKPGVADGTAVVLSSQEQYAKALVQRIDHRK
ncbi:MAG: hypothetical protein OXF33_14520 [Rhodospirillales bacterium]|nr:hypothetical protein [Rhodospirillales bacterium]